MPASPCSTRPAAPWGRCASWTRDRAPGRGTNSSGCTMPPGCWDTRWTGGHQDEPERNPTNGGAPPRAGARRTRATVEVAPPADDIWSAAHSRVAQLVEQPAVNRRVAGSSPASGAPQIRLSQRVLAQPRNPRRAPVRSGDGWNGPDPMDRGGFPEGVGPHLDVLARPPDVGIPDISIGGRQIIRVAWPSGGLYVLRRRTRAREVSLAACEPEACRRLQVYGLPPSTNSVAAQSWLRVPCSPVAPALGSLRDSLSSSDVRDARTRWPGGRHSPRQARTPAPQTGVARCACRGWRARPQP